MKRHLPAIQETDTDITKAVNQTQRLVLKTVEQLQALRTGLNAKLTTEEKHEFTATLNRVDLLINSLAAMVNRKVVRDGGEGDIKTLLDARGQERQKRKLAQQNRKDCNNE